MELHTHLVARLFAGLAGIWWVKYQPECLHEGFGMKLLYIKVSLGHIYWDISCIIRVGDSREKNLKDRCKIV